VITDIRPRHTSADFVAFLNKVDRNVPKDLDVHVILDNLSAHKTPTVQRWLLRHRRFHLHFTPTYGSWMNLVERWFSALTTKKRDN
jgi:transposase